MADDVHGPTAGDPPTSYLLVRHTCQMEKILGAAGGTEYIVFEWEVLVSKFSLGYISALLCNARQKSTRSFRYQWGSCYQCPARH
jgi:hypothetical protein